MQTRQTERYLKRSPSKDPRYTTRAGVLNPWVGFLWFPCWSVLCPAVNSAPNPILSPTIPSVRDQYEHGGSFCFSDLRPLGHTAHYPAIIKVGNRHQCLFCHPHFLPLLQVHTPQGPSIISASRGTRTLSFGRSRGGGHGPVADLVSTALRCDGVTGVFCPLFA